MQNFNLRPYQLQLIADIKKEFKDNSKSVCAVLSCGGGKSVIAAAIAKSATEKNNKVLFLVHRKELCQQIEKTFINYGVDMDLCTIAMVQTISRRLDKLPAYKIIITDEFHHGTSSTYKKIYKFFPDALKIGFTATPTRLNQGGLEDVADALVTSVSTKWLIENNFLSPYKYYCMELSDNKNLKTTRGEYDSKQLSTLMEDNAIYGLTVKNYKNIADGKKAIVYCVSVKSAQETATEFQQNGYSAVALDAETCPKERFEMMEKFRNNEIQILVNCQLFGEGLDVPDCECVILLRKTKSLTLYIQQSMRSMRYKKGKTALIIDHVGNVFEHGLPDDDREWSLDKKQKGGGGEVNIKTCPECYCVLSSSIKICSQCGHIFGEIKETQIIDVDLKELSKQDLIKSKPYKEYKNMKSFDDMFEFANTHDNVKRKIMWTIFKCLECNIDIPEKHNNLINLANRIKGGSKDYRI